LLRGFGRRGAERQDQVKLEARKVGGKIVQTFRTIIAKAVFDDDVFSFDIAEFAQTLLESGELARLPADLPLHSQPTRGIWPALSRSCCAPAASGQAAAAPPSRAMKSRRFN
jgi:hypothetical protein